MFGERKKAIGQKIKIPTLTVFLKNVTRYFLFFLVHIIILININMELSGRLFTYNIAKRLTAFESGVLNSNKTIIFVGGLGDGYSAVPYLPLLNENIEKLGYSLIQIQMTSSYVGYGNVTLSEDASELDDLITYLKQVKKKQVIFIIGHSTGRL